MLRGISHCVVVAEYLPARGVIIIVGHNAIAVRGSTRGANVLQGQRGACGVAAKKPRCRVECQLNAAAYLVHFRVAIAVGMITPYDIKPHD
jgi:hypothetical protein